ATARRRAALVLVRPGALPRSAAAHRDGAGAEHRTHPGPGTRPVVARDVLGPAGRAGGDRSRGRRERGDPAGDGRRIGGSRGRARRTGAVVSARGWSGTRGRRDGGGPCDGARRATALLDHL